MNVNIKKINNIKIERKRWRYINELSKIIKRLLEVVMIIFDVVFYNYYNNKKRDK